MNPIPSAALRCAAHVHAALAVLLVAASVAAAAATPLPPGPVQGEVLEARNVDSYTYLRLKTAGGEVWAAVPTTGVKPGARVTLTDTMVMENFESRTLKKTFDRILFGQLAEPGAATGAGPAKAHAPGPAAALPAPAARPIKVDKATGPDARTVAEVVTGKAALKGKSVLVRGQVVKVSTGIMGKNWLHLRDGSGSAADGSDDILVTTQGMAAPGDIVSVKGTVRTDLNLGSGYAYAVLIEDADLRK